MSPYSIFARQEIERIKEDYPGIDQRTAAKRVGINWAALNSGRPRVY
jgi:predicted DNA-binding protein (UPF0251 family)